MFKFVVFLFGDGLVVDVVKVVVVCDIGVGQVVVLVVQCVFYCGLWLVQIVDGDILYVVDDVCVYGVLCIVKVMCYFGLVIDYDLFVGQCVKVDMYYQIGIGQIVVVMGQFFVVYVCGYVCFVQYLYCVLFQNVCLDV